jgi:predicted acyl esterase
MRPLDPAALTSRPELDVHLAENVPVAMRDGVRLATDVYRPARDGRPVADRRPALLHRTPYNKTETEATLGQCRWFAARGWVVVNQDVVGLDADGHGRARPPGAGDAAVEVTGPIEVHLWVATSAVDTDFTAKLIDVYPPSPWFPLGYALNLTDSLARLRYRNGRERGEPVTPGEPVAVTLTLYPTSNLFAAGHRTRLDVSSSNHPRFDVNPNTGEPLGRDRRRVVADNTVFHERGRASRVVLPIIPLEPSHA